MKKFIKKMKDKSFNYNDLFDAFVAGDTESMRTGDDVDKEEFNEWLKIKFKKNKK